MNEQMHMQGGSLAYGNRIVTTPPRESAVPAR